MARSKTLSHKSIVSTRRRLAAICSLAIATGTVHAATPLTFAQTIALPGTLSGWDFETPGYGVEADLYYGPAGSDNPTLDSFLSNHPNGYPNNGGFSMQTNFNVSVTDSTGDGNPLYPVRDGTVSEFPGGTSMKFTIKGASYQKAGGDFIIPFKRTGTEGNYKFAQFGPGGEFWVRFAMREDQQLLSTSDFYIRSGGGHQGGVKRLIVHGTVSAGSLEETIQDTNQRRIPQMYSDAGNEFYGAQDFLGCYENDSVTPDNFNSPLNYPEPPCRQFKADTWTTYHVHVKVADNAAKNNGLVELYVNDETSPIIKVTNSDHSGTSITQPYIETGTWDTSGNDEKGYGKLSFTLWATNKVPSSGIPDAHMWIDNIIVSKVRAAPLIASGSGDVLKPDPPTGVSAQ